MGRSPRLKICSRVHLKELGSGSLQESPKNFQGLCLPKLTEIFKAYEDKRP